MIHAEVFHGYGPPVEVWCSGGTLPRAGTAETWYTPFVKRIKIEQHKSFPKNLLYKLEEFNTVDGRNPKQPPGIYETLVNNGISTISLNWLGQWFHHTVLQGGSRVEVAEWISCLGRKI